MRDDMAQVIVERPRLGGGVKFPRGSARATDRVPIDAWHQREGIGRPWQRTSCQKSLNENLAPLRRFLRSNVGRPWDKVYGEICERINRDSAVQLHIWQHLVQYVCTNPYVISGEVGRYWQGRPACHFFVDPRTGLLRENVGYPGRWRGPQPRESDASLVAIDDRRCCQQIDGIWYELELGVPPASGTVYDTGAGREVQFMPRDGFRTYRGRRVFVARKRQMNTKEIRRRVAHVGG